MNHTQLEKISNGILLNRLLSHSDFARFNEWGSDDWRDPNEKNPSLSLSSKGWYNHKTGAEGSLYDLAKKRDLLEVPQDPLNIQENRDQKGQSDTTKQAERLWKQEESQPAKERSQHYLSEQRKIPIENYKDLLGSYLRCVEDNQGREILLCPMLTPDQRDSAEAGSSFSAEKVHRVILLEGDRYEKKQLGSPSDGVGRISYLPPLSEDCESLQYLVIEGLEDALSIRSRYRDHHFLVCQSKGNLKHVPEFLTNGAEVLILSDHDGHANPNENGEYAAAELRQQLLRSGYECTAWMPAEAGDDANEALKEERLDEWSKSLQKVPELPGSKRDFCFRSSSTLKFEKPNWLIEEVIEQRTLSAIIGESGSGKTFLALDIASSIGTGRSWHGRSVQQGSVFYFLGEGRGRFKTRLEAWGQYHGQQAKIELSEGVIDLCESDQLRLVQQALRDHRKNPTLIIIDTLARHYSSDENSASEMNKFIRHLDELRSEFNTAVLVVHHSGKDSSRGARGSSAFRAALDHELLVAKSGTGYMTLTCEKARDWEPFDPIEFQLCNQDVLVDGEPVPSCVLEERAYVQSSKTRELSAKERMAKEQFLELSEQSEDGTVKRSSWYKDLKDKDIAPHDPQKKRMFNKMVEFGVFESHGEGRDVYLIPGIQKDYDYP